MRPSNHRSISTRKKNAINKQKKTSLPTPSFRTLDSLYLLHAYFCFEWTLQKKKTCPYTQLRALAYDSSSFFCYEHCKKKKLWFQLICRNWAGFPFPIRQTSDCLHNFFFAFFFLGWVLKKTCRSKNSSSKKKEKNDWSHPYTRPMFQVLIFSREVTSRSLITTRVDQEPWALFLPARLRTINIK